MELIQLVEAAWCQRGIISTSNITNIIRYRLTFWASL